jgi:hypothetical protein
MKHRFGKLLVILAAGFSTSSLTRAQDFPTDIYVLVGRYYLAQSNLPYANIAFSAASGSEGKTLKALSALALLQHNPNTIGFLNKLYYDSPVNVWQTRTTGYKTNLSRPVPYRTQTGLGGAQALSILKDIYFPAMVQAETDLASFVEDGLLVPLGRSETGYPDINLDRGDVLMIRSLLACGRFLIQAANSQNVNGLVNDYILLEEEPGPVTIENILSRFPDIAKLANPSDLPSARVEAKKAIALYKQASEWIRTARPLGQVRMFNLPGSFGVTTSGLYNASLVDEAKFRAKLDEYAALMDGPVDITGFDQENIGLFNGKPLLDGLVNLRSKTPAFRKNKMRQGTITDATFGGIYPTNTVARSEAYLWRQTLECPKNPYTFGLFVPPVISVGGLGSISEGYEAPKLPLAWGDNWSGQTNIPLGLTNVAAIAAGAYHSLALKSDGTVAGWGRNWENQINIPGDLINITAIAAGAYHSLALKSDGTVAGWGYNWNGQINIPSDLSNVVAIAAGYDGSLALRSDGTVRGWGSWYFSGVPWNANSVTAIAAGSYHSLALKSNGTVVGWGANWNGQINIPWWLNNVTAVAAGSNHSLALKSDGTVVGWGANWSGQINIPWDLTNVIAIAAGDSHSIALKSDGTIIGWGANWSGQLNPPPNLKGVTAISSGTWANHNLTLVQGTFLTLQRSGDPSEDIPVTLALGGTAQLGLDYANPVASYTLPSGSTETGLNPYTLVNDSTPEFDETSVIYGTPAAETEASFTPFTLTIVDDDGSGVGIFATDNQGREGRMNPDPFGFKFGVYDPIRFEVRRTGSTASALSVKVSRDLLLSSATPHDYQITGFDVDGQTVRIPAGRSSAELVVSPRYDIEYPEGAEILVMKVLTDPGYALTPNGTAEAHILDSSPYEWWTYQMGLLVANHPPVIDFDGDGMPNLLEMALGKDPKLFDSADCIQQGRDAEGYLTITFKRWSGGVSNSDGSYVQHGVTYKPQATSSLENPSSWGSSSMELHSINDTEDGMELVTYRDTLSKTQNSRFVRVIVTLNE